MSAILGIRFLGHRLNMWWIAKVLGTERRQLMETPQGTFEKWKQGYEMRREES
jgi:hypothetical protein